MVRTRFIGSGRARESGYSATHKQDFMSHSTGDDWRHNASQIDLSSPITGYDATTVQDLFAEIVTEGTEGGFVTIGDGYNTEPKQDLSLAFEWALSQGRISTNGGIIVIKPGEYVLRKTVTIPRGVTVWGEPGGAVISSEVTNGPAFLFRSTIDIINLGNGNSSIVSTKMSRLWNLTLLDNKDGVVNSGYPAHLVRELISLEEGCELLLENVTIFGRVYNNRNTSYAIKTVLNSETIPSYASTILHVNKCYIDGVRYAIEFNPTGAPELAELRVENSRVRTYHSSSTGSGGFIRTVINKIFINNNYYLSFSPSGSSAMYGAFLTLLTQATAVTGGFVTLINNKGGLENISNPSGEDTNSRKYWIYDLRAVKWAFNLSEIGNTWGAVNSNDWFITIGDGVHSTGDFTGTNALELVNSLTTVSGSSQDFLNSRIEQLVIINPGTYTVNSALSIGKLFGNTTVSNSGTLSRQIVINLNSDQLYGVGPMRSNYIGQAENIKFVAINNLQHIDVGYEYSQSGNVLKNVSFVNCEVSVKNLDKAIVENCSFQQTGSFVYDVVDLLAVADVVKISDCIFDGYGYALRVNNSNAFVTVTDCTFNVTNIRGWSIQTNQRNYIYINYVDKIHINNIKINSSQILVPNSMLTNYSSRYKDHVFLAAEDSIIVENSYISGPDQKGAVPIQFYHSIICCSLNSKNTIKLINNEIVGGVPVYISGFNTNVGPNVLGGNIDIQNNDIHHYESPTDGVTNALVINITDAGYSDYPMCVGSLSEDLEGQMSWSNINISNNKITGFIKGLLSCALDANTTLKSGGLVSVTALGWNVNIVNNDINFSGENFSLTTTTNLTTPINVFCLSALYLDNILTGADVYSIAKVNNNNIIYHNTQNLSATKTVCVNTKNVIGIINNNVMMTWFCNTVGSGRYYIYEESVKNGNLICNNSFNSNYSTVMGYSIYVVGSGYGVISSNWFDNINDNVFVTGANASSWIVTSENYGTFDFAVP